ncbi:AfsR/SARP family transcriptional regulator [Streptomyces wuyuanensis]|uniref:DNA-binding transcriptional activator of the SARP family n=1 Tax=Streptomyces wuyuanensis TaxID=1196353 RepID=A0A1G9U162_9ACTN|nr:BTAD domain-containing putative transcriptional regulator [Streptomyces wuyuanensis]SDM53394.1 DNA-binding transcriptional activator of the SARP family [Streptomyces wuyuanensis]
MRFQLLGPLSITDGSDTVVLPPSKPTILLASLLLHANTVVSVEYLQRTMWGEEQPATARAALQTCVLRLRRLFVKHGVTGAPIEAVPGGYRISAGPDSLDLIGFRERVRLAAAYAHDPGRELHTLEDALSLWQGPLLANVRSDVLRRDEVPRLAEERLRTVEKVCDLQLALGRCGEALVALWGATRAHPGHERFREQLIEALYRSGRQTEALAEYRRVKAYLRAELGVDPSPALRELELAILRGEDLGRALPSLATVVPARPRLPVAAGQGAGRPAASLPPSAPAPQPAALGAVPDPAAGTAREPAPPYAQGDASRRPVPAMPHPDAVPSGSSAGAAPGDDGGTGPPAARASLHRAFPDASAGAPAAGGGAGWPEAADGGAAPHVRTVTGSPDVAPGAAPVPAERSAGVRPMTVVAAGAEPRLPPSVRGPSGASAHAAPGDGPVLVVPVAPVPAFTGRASETAALGGRLTAPEGPDSATVVVSGAPGIGKTALARQVAHLAGDGFPGGRYLVRMVRPDGVPLTAGEVTAEVAAALGEPHTRGRVLLVLDDVLDADQVLPLLHTRPDASAVVTSRRGLAGLIAAHGGWVQRLGPLAEDESYELLGTALGSERVGAEPDAARALADACCHHPLALRIVTARLLTRPALRLADCAEWLAGDPLARLSLPGSPHMALRKVLDSALGRLDRGAARAFPRIGSHTTGELHASDASALLGLPLPETEDLLERLADAGLLEEGPPGPYRMHDLLRLYARGNDSPSVRPTQKV